MMEGLCFYSSKYRVTKGFKFHAQPQTGAYSCLSWLVAVLFAQIKAAAPDDRCLIFTALITANKVQMTVLALGEQVA